MKRRNEEEQTNGVFVFVPVSQRDSGGSGPGPPPVDTDILVTMEDVVRLWLTVKVLNCIQYDTMILEIK